MACQGRGGALHVPLHAAPSRRCRPTVDVLATALAVLVAAKRRIATTLRWRPTPGTFFAGPASLRPRHWAAGIAAELRFTQHELLALGLSEQHPAEAR